MNLNEALHQIAIDLNMPPADLIAYAAEDTIGGYHTNAALAKWPMGSLWEVEGQVLYAVTRAMRPERVLEVGVYFGASSTHILAALAKNKKGKLISFDIQGSQGDGPPGELRKRWEFIQADSNDYLAKTPITADLVFEDGYHDRIGTERNLRTIMEIVRPRILISHDAEHFTEGINVRGAWSAVFGDQYKTILIAPSDCGLAYGGHL